MDFQIPNLHKASPRCVQLQLGSEARINMKTAKIIFGISILLFALGYLTYSYNMQNPFKEVKWIEHNPGAGDRYVEFTPVLKSNNKIKLGPTVGADYAELRFKDLNDDGVKEVVIETEVLFPHGDFYSHERHVLGYKLSPTGQPQFVLIKSEKLGENF